MPSSGKQFKQALNQECPLQIAGVINAYCAILAERAGFKALYLSGAGVANASFGLPDLALTHFDDLLTEATRITDISPLPLLVDIDTGFSQEVSAKQLITQLTDAGVAAIQIEDQIEEKRCGHLEGKKLVTSIKMQDRLEALIQAKTDADFLIMARTDAYAVEGLQAAIQRAIDYQKIGADMIFAESLSSLEDYKCFTDALEIPVLANLTEFGQTPLFSVQELASVNIAMLLYPLSAFRAMSLAALETYKTIKKTGSQKTIISNMQTRDELYDLLNYDAYNDKPITEK